MSLSIGRGGTGGVGAGRALLSLTVLALVLEFLLGTDVNVYYTCLPGAPMHVFSSNPCGSQPGLEAHVALGAVLGLLALVALVWAARRRVPGLLGPVFGGFLGVVVAALGGYEYLSNGNDAWSFLMAVAFLVAFGSYFSAFAALREYSRSGGARSWSPVGSPPS